MSTSPKGNTANPYGDVHHHGVTYIYTVQNCIWCKAAKDLLTDNGLGFREMDVERSTHAASDMVTLGGQAVPQIFMGANHVGGFDELRVLESTGRLHETLNRRSR